MIGTKFYKNQYSDEEYLKASEWCNQNNSLIVDKGDYFEIIESPSLTEKEQRALIQQQLTIAVQNWLDKTVQNRNYDSIHTACTYAYSTDEIFKKEGTACLVWRDSVWRTCYNILNEVLAGTREIPTEEELIAELPKLEW